MKMRDLLSVERVIPQLRARSKQDVLRKLAAYVDRDTSAPAAAIVRSVLEGADLPDFGPGAGVSLVHAFVPRLVNPMAIFARLEPSVDFGAADGSNTDLVALLLNSVEKPRDHLRALACIARTLRDPNVSDLLRAAENRDALYAILCEREEQYWSRELAPVETLSMRHRCTPPPRSLKELDIPIDDSAKEQGQVPSIVSPRISRGPSSISKPEQNASSLARDRDLNDNDDDPGPSVA